MYLLENFRFKTPLYALSLSQLQFFRPVSMDWISSCRLQVLTLSQPSSPCQKHSDCTQSALQALSPAFLALPQGKSLLRATSIAWRSTYAAIMFIVTATPTHTTMDKIFRHDKYQRGLAVCHNAWHYTFFLIHYFIFFPLLVTSLVDSENTEILIYFCIPNRIWSSILWIWSHLLLLSDLIFSGFSLHTSWSSSLATFATCQNTAADHWSLL